MTSTVTFRSYDITIFFRIRSLAKRQTRRSGRGAPSSGDASAGLYQILSEGIGLTAMPRPSSGRPLKVFLAVAIESITDISEVNMDMTVTIVIHQAWHDHRKGFAREHSKKIVVSHLVLEIGLFCISCIKNYIVFFSVKKLRTIS